MIVAPEMTGLFSEFDPQLLSTNAKAIAIYNFLIFARIAQREASVKVFAEVEPDSEGKNIERIGQMTLSRAIKINCRFCFGGSKTVPKCENKYCSFNRSDIPSWIGYGEGVKSELRITGQRSAPGVLWELRRGYSRTC